MVSPTLIRSAAFLGPLGSMWLSGINFSASNITLPVLYRLNKTVSADVFAEIFIRGGWLTVPLTLFSGIANAIAAYHDPVNRFGYTIAAAFTLLCLPFTGLIMRPTISRLMTASKDPRECEKMEQQEVVRLLKAWTWLNYVRSTMAGIGGVAGVATIAKML